MVTTKQVTVLIKVRNNIRKYISKDFNVISGFIVLDLLNTTSQEQAFIANILHDKSCNPKVIIISSLNRFEVTGVLKPRQIAKARKIINSVIKEKPHGS